MLILFYTFLVLVSIKAVYSSEEFLSNISGEVRGGNFSYYMMSYDGTILIELTSTLGDCDLYVSQNTLKPSFEPESNCLQSVTCGIDSVVIPKSFKRPIGVGIYGHLSHEVSSYYMTFYKIDDSLDIFYYDSYSETLQTHKNKKTKNHNFESRQNDEPEESFFWVLLSTVLQFIIEVIL